MTTSTNNRRLVLAGFAAAVAGIVLLRAFDPATSGVFPPCPLWYLTGWYCPGCGSLRAMHQLMHGNLFAAWAMNPLTVILLPFIVYGLASSLVLGLWGKRLPHLFVPAVWIRSLAIAIVIFGIVRNLPLHPFDWLAPGAMLRF